MPEQPVEHVEDDDRARIADMGKVVDGRSADIHADIPTGPWLSGHFIERTEFLLGPRARIVELQTHEPVSPGYEARRSRSNFLQKENGRASLCQLAIIMPQMMMLVACMIMAGTLEIFPCRVKRNSRKVHAADRS